MTRTKRQIGAQTKRILVNEENPLERRQIQLQESNIHQHSLLIVELSNKPTNVTNKEQEKSKLNGSIIKDFEFPTETPRIKHRKEHEESAHITPNDNTRR